VYDDFQSGESVRPTTDIRTDAGWVQLVNADAQQQEEDYQKIVKWMPSMFDVGDNGGR
jgi:hypothetical protein